MPQACSRKQTLPGHASRVYSHHAPQVCIVCTLERGLKWQKPEALEALREGVMSMDVQSMTGTWLP